MNTPNNNLPEGEGQDGVLLITIIGPSGAGKDTAARILSEIMDIPVLVSYTTRPMREGEANGREHYFVNECTTSKDQMLAYTVYGGYEYWTELSQIKKSAIYVIDEEGLKDLHDRFPGIKIVSIYITANKLTRLKRGVTFERIRRDDDREAFPLDYYDYRIMNNFTTEHLRETLQCIADTMF